jgi:hypothetical protein
MKKYSSIFQKLSLLFFLGAFFFAAFLSFSNSNFGVPASYAGNKDEDTCATGTTACPAYPTCCDNDTHSCKTTTTTTTEGESTITQTTHSCEAKTPPPPPPGSCSDTNCGGRDCTRNTLKKKCKCEGDGAPKCVTGVASQIQSEIQSGVSSGVRSVISGIFSN